MGRGYEVSWSGLNGVIEGRECQGALSLEIHKETDPFWFASMHASGDQVSKNFEEGKLDQAYDWCVTNIKKYETESIARRGSESADR